MLDSYKSVSNIIKVLKSEVSENKDELMKMQAVLFQDKDFFVNKIQSFLKEQIDLDYNFYTVNDINGNRAHLLVRQASKIFEKYIDGKEIIEFDIEELIDSRMFDNTNEIIILDLNFDDNLINLEYMCKTFEYYYLSYSDSFKKRLEAFIDYILSRNISYLE